MHRVVVSCVVLVALVVPLGCAKSKGSKAEFCRELRRTSGLDEVLSGFATDDPATIRRKMREAADQFSKLERAAPREVRSDVTQVSDLVGKVVDIVDRSPDDPQEIAKRLRAVALTAGGAPAAALRLSRYAKDQCQLDLNAPPDASGGPPTTSPPGGTTPSSAPERVEPPAQRISPRRTITWSMMPYSLACSAVNQRSRSESASICSTGLAGVVGDALGHEPLDVDHLLGLDGDVGRLALNAARGLVHHDPGVGQGVALAGGAGAEQELAHRRGQAHADRAHVGLTNCIVS